MFHGHVAMLNPCGVEWDHNNDPVSYEISQEFPEIRKALKASFSKYVQPKIQTL
jgi:hypothetical protein